MPLVLAAAVVIDLAVVLAAVDGRLPQLWVERLLVAGPTLSVLALTSLVPFVLAYQLPRFWMEKSTGVALEAVWRSKLLLAALLAVGPLLVGLALIVLLHPGHPLATAAACLQLIASATVVSSIVGLAVFEIAEQPFMGLTFGALVGLAVAALFVFYPAAWWLWLVVYGYLAAQIAGRASRRVRFTEVTR